MATDMPIVAAALLLLAAAFLGIRTGAADDCPHALCAKAERHTGQTTEAHRRMD